MPAGDPAGYLPNVIKKRIKKAGATPYKARSKQRPKKLVPGTKPRPKANPTGGVEAPPKVTPLPRRSGGGGKFVPRPFKPKRRSV